jgi:hypothetical protein
MYQRVEVHGRGLYSGLTGVCLILIFTISRAKADTVVTPVPLAPLVLNGSLLLNLIPRVDFVDFGNYSLFQPEPGPFEGDSRMFFRALGTPAPVLAGEIDAGEFQFGRAVATLTYELEVLGPPGSIPILIDVSGAVSGHVDPGDPLATLLLQSNWGIEDLVLGPVFSDAIDSGVQHEEFARNFSHTVFVAVTANHIHRVTMFIDVEAGGGKFGANATASIDPVFSFAPGVDPAYSFQFSDGIGNSPNPAVPEPSSIVLLSTGAIAIGLLRRHSRLRYRHAVSPQTSCGSHRGRCERAGIQHRMVRHRSVPAGVRGQ